MNKLSYGLKKLKIIEQIAIVFFIAVVIPMSISGFIINNINQQSLRRQLRESAVLITGVVADELNFLINSNELALVQIAETLDYIPNNSQKNKFIRNIAEKYPNCDKIYISKNQSELEKLTDNVKKNDQPILSTKLKDGTFLSVVFNSKNIDNKLFNSLGSDVRQVYILDKNNHLVASNNFDMESFEQTMDLLPKNNLTEDSPVIFGDEKNRPIVYLKSSNPEYTVIVNTTDQMTKQAIYSNRVKIILAVLVSILSMMLLIGFYIYYLYINIRQLFKAIIAISKGNYHRQIRLLTTSFTPYEIVFLANEFNNMVSKIHNAYLELQKKNKELKELNEFRSNLIDTVSHELRTPLTSIQGYTSRLLRQDIVIDDETKQKSLRIIKEQSERLKRLIEDLLTIPDIEGMRLRTVNTEVWLEEVLEQSELLLRKKNGHEIIIKSLNNCPSVVADKGRLEQVFVNLFENAVKYSEPDTPIMVDIEQNSDKVVVRVKNKCPKIPKDKLNKLYDKFVRLDDAMTRTTRGTGLGLFIVKGLIEAMNGSIRLSSDDNWGFCASITLRVFEKDNLS